MVLRFCSQNRHAAFNRHLTHNHKRLKGEHLPNLPSDLAVHSIQVALEWICLLCSSVGQLRWIGMGM